MRRAGRRRLFAALASGAFAATILAEGPAQAQQAAQETKDRVTNEELAALVAPALALAGKGELAQAGAAVHDLVAEAQARADKVRAADMLMGYALGLYAQAETRRAAIPWLAEAAAAAEAAWGPAHAETALALQSYADGIRKTSPEPPPPDVERLLRRVLAIRVQALGPDNGETLMTMRVLAETLAAGPTAAKPDPRRAAEAAALFGRAIPAIAGSNMQNPLEQTVAARLAFARLSARGGQADDALAQFEATRTLLVGQHGSGEDSANACRAFLHWGPRLYQALLAHGAAAAAEKVRGEGEAIQVGACAAAAIDPAS